MIRAVIFDVDGVLIDSLRANYQWCRNVAHVAGYSPPTLRQYKPMFHLSGMDVIRRIAKDQSEDEVQKIWELSRSGKIRYPFEKIIVSKSVGKTLAVLHRTHSLALVSQRIRDHICQIPQLAPVLQYFQVVIGYEDTDRHKPHPEPLLAAAKRLQVPVGEIVYVGDAEVDYVASRSAGMKIIMYKNSLPGADAYASSFTQLPRVISSL